MVSKAAPITGQEAGGVEGGDRCIKRGAVAAKKAGAAEGERRLSRRSLQEVGGGDVGSRYRERAAAGTAAVAESGRLLIRW